MPFTPNGSWAAQVVLWRATTGWLAPLSYLDRNDNHLSKHPCQIARFGSLAQNGVMSIKVTCQCGQSFAAKDKLAGRRVKCPHCAEPLEIPGRVADRPATALAGAKKQRNATEQGDATEQRGTGAQRKSDRIPVVCQCGKRLKVKREMAGKRVKCPQCGQPLTIPGKAPAATKQPAEPAALTNQIDELGDLLEDVGLAEIKEGTPCPKCSAAMPPDAVLCVKCGYNFQTGKQLKTVVMGGTNARQNSAEQRMARARKELKKEKEKNRRELRG